MNASAPGIRRPVIGITCDTHQRAPGDAERGRFRYECAPHYAAAVTRAGGTPLLLPFETDRLNDYLALCDGFILTGGDDPDTSEFGDPVHPNVRLMRPERQAFELALLRALDDAAHPVLGVCLGMQLMALHHGGRLHQYLPDAARFAADAPVHREDHHAIRPAEEAHPSLTAPGTVYSHHVQAVADPGRMRTVALSGEPTREPLIEAVDLPDAEPAGRFYLGVQWHPERTEEPTLGQQLFHHLVQASGG
jgi:gamma-glutamyl-gamma-aminobutyrate hydrolase PuuD